ncbi:hypothetical protein FRB90_006696, partial [Tulasnella sp. 427]
WEVLCGLSFDVMIIKKLLNRELQRASPTVVYFFCKYGTLISIIGINVANNVTYSLPCQTFYTNNQFWGNVAIGGASTLLMFRSLRTYYAKAQLPVQGAVKTRWTWRSCHKVKLALYIGSAGQWAILLYNVTTVKSAKAIDGSSCVVTDTDPVLLMVLYCYTMAFDFVVLTVCAVGLVRIPSPESRLWRLACYDALIYCAVAFSANTIATVFIVLRLNPIMEVMFAVPAGVLSAVVACRSFRRLNKQRNVNEVELGNIVRNAHLDPPRATPPPSHQPKLVFPHILPRRHPESPQLPDTESSAKQPFNVEEVHTISVPVLINANRNGDITPLPPRQYLVRTVPRMKDSESSSAGTTTRAEGHPHGWAPFISKSFLWPPSDSQGVSTSTSGIVFATPSEDGSRFELEEYTLRDDTLASVGVVDVGVVALGVPELAKRVSVEETRSDGDDNGTLVHASPEFATATEMPNLSDKSA